MKKKLTVLVPSYNFGDYIIDCIDSIYKQKTNFEFDVIVRDDNSTDDTFNKLQILKTKYPSLKVLDGSVNLGAFNNIKKLYESTNSEYISYLDGDDMFGDENKLQIQVNFLDQNPTHVMCFTGCRYLYEDGRIYPDDSRVICSVKDVITTNDLLEKNYVGFGRMFRNIPNIFKEEYSNLPYVDWPMGYELSKHGLVGYLDMFGGLYRISDKGIYSKLSEEEKVIGFNQVRKVINENYIFENYKTITIVDSFISNNSVLTKLKTCIKNLNRHNHTILLVSNTVPPQDVIESVDYFLYNKENKLFRKKYENLVNVDLWKAYSDFVIHDIVEELQRHGLSVLCNLFNALDLSVSLGFTHFQRVEVDDMFSDEGYDFMKKVPSLCFLNSKKSLFYFNDDKDVSFHYFFSEIKFFIDTVVRIQDEESYIDYLKNKGFGLSFKPVEVFLYDNLTSGDINSVLIRDGINDINQDFSGTVWNTETSPSTLDPMYSGCTTKIYKVQNQDKYVILSFNYNFGKIRRKIKVIQNGLVTEIFHDLENKGWFYHSFDKFVDKIQVINDITDELLYEQENKNLLDYIEFK